MDLDGAAVIRVRKKVASDKHPHADGAHQCTGRNE